MNKTLILINVKERFINLNKYNYSCQKTKYCKYAGPVVRNIWNGNQLSQTFVAGNVIINLKRACQAAQLV